MSVYFFQNKKFPKDSSFNSEKGVAFEVEGIFVASALDRDLIMCDDSTGKTLKDWVEKCFGDTCPVESDYVPGTFYKRIWRPVVSGGNFYKAISQERLNESFVSLKILLDRLEELFETVEPTEENKKVYGYKIREIILLACTEVESSWSAILKENQYLSKKGYFTTNDYVFLARPMLLDSYELSLQSYLNFSSFNPFENWNSDQPTKSLSWYDAYNYTKHDREKNLKYATLENAIKSVGSVIVMFHAQFGFNFGAFDKKLDIIRNVFRVVAVGLKKYEKEYYIPKFKLERHQPIPTGEWSGINYSFVDY
ncbi:MAG: hypothetical protein PHC85_00210 [Candidatus Pacebacteria bacterium]|nr:hypothetical protein [Candidatus Paceibacterota bacterium]